VGTKNAQNGSEPEPKEVEQGGKVIPDWILILLISKADGIMTRHSLDHVLGFREMSLRRILRSYLDYYHRSRTHLSLGKDSPEPRSIQPEPVGRVVALPQVGGLHHRYERRAA
jgi:putative transposase